MPSSEASDGLHESEALLNAVDPDTSEFLYVSLYPERTIALTERFLRQLLQKHRLQEASFLADGAPWLQAALDRYDLRFQQITHGNRNAVKHIYRSIEYRTNQFQYYFRHAPVDSAESWLQTSTSSGIS